MNPCFFSKNIREVHRAEIACPRPLNFRDSPASIVLITPAGP
jgi:hypothetical protein